MTTAKRYLLLFLATGFLLAASAAPAAIESPYQAPERPLGLDIVGPVYASGSDERAEAFNEYGLPFMLPFIPDGGLDPENSVLGIDPGELYMNEDSFVRIYFVGEHTGRNNSLAFTAKSLAQTLAVAEEVETPQGLLIFPRGGSRGTYGDVETALSVTPDHEQPLISGDFVDLGFFAAGTQLELFLISDGGANDEGLGLLYTQPGNNADGLEHVAKFDIGDSQYTLIGYEDILGGGDLDYDDFLFAIEIWPGGSTSIPEPGTMAIGMLLLPAAILLKRKRG